MLRYIDTGFRYGNQAFRMSEVKQQFNRISTVKCKISGKPRHCVIPVTGNTIRTETDHYYRFKFI